MLLTPAQIKPKLFDLRWNSLFFLPGVDAPHVYVRALVLGCFWFTTSFLQPLPYLVTLQGPKTCQLTNSFFVGAQTVISLLQTTQIKQGVPFISANKVYTSTNKTTIVLIETEHFLFTRGGCVSCLRACFGARLLLQSY